MSLDPYRATAQEKVLDAEQAVLGSMLLSSDAISVVSSVLEPTDYYRPAHETIHRTICLMHEQGTPADPITAAAALGRSGDLNRVGGASYLHTLVQAVPTVAHAEHYAHIIRDAAQDRRLDSAGRRILQRGDEGDTATVRADAIAALEQLATTDQWGEPTPLGEHRALPTFPVESLPDWLRDQVAAVAEFTQTPRIWRPRWVWLRSPPLQAAGSTSRSAPAGPSRPTCIWSARCPRRAGSRTSSQP